MLRITLLLALVAFSCHATPASNDAAIDQLYRSVTVGDHETAVKQSKDLEKNHRGDIVSKVVEKLIEESQRNVIDYAYQLWNRDGKDIVKNYFPLQFRSILSELKVKLINKRDGMAVKLGVKVDSDGDRTAYGDSSDTTGDRMAWKIIPISSDSKVYFKIYNVPNNQFLKLGTATDGDGDHAAYGSTSSDTNRHQWYLQPAKFNNELLFYIFNREYHHALKLSRAVDSDGDRQLYGHNGNVIGSPDLFGWIIAPF